MWVSWVPINNCGITILFHPNQFAWSQYHRWYWFITRFTNTIFFVINNIHTNFLYSTDFYKKQRRKGSTTKYFITAWMEKDAFELLVKLMGYEPCWRLTASETSLETYLNPTFTEPIWPIPPVSKPWSITCYIEKLNIEYWTKVTATRRMLWNP